MSTQTHDPEQTEDAIEQTEDAIEQIEPPPFEPPAPDEFAPDALVDNKIADQPAQVIKLVGYLGRGGTDAYRRLYKGPDMREWVTIPTGAIVDRRSHDDAALTHGKSIVWVERSAHVVECKAVCASIYELSPQATAGYGEDDATYRPWPR